ncbi:helicase [Nocardioides sp. Root1257]|uniref:DEAD/DEAH box helicase n=1 Tax=unclassified Nocardioides TaxID=2615069 RepID=UPI0006FDE9C2|nr:MULTISPECIES: DEAD/DEAH box helicase [unclassified Nocardioides]KQW47492.1 helicase [Nocardioides sp. Root1257]KRC45648.1 helicase [Nocardioides sp. Root224]
MSFVPLTGPATFRAGEPPREGVVEFTDERRTVALPIRAALPVLTKARNRDDLHPSVGLLSGAALLGMRFVAAGKFAPQSSSPGGPPSWRVSGLDEDDEERIEMLARAQREDERVVRDLIDAVADAMPRQPPVEVPDRRREPSGPSRPSFEERLQARLAKHRRVDPTDLPQLVRLSVRVEADEEELVAGAVRLVPQVHDEQNPLHLCDLAELWTHGAAEHGFGDRARTHATIALRAAADAWPVLDRLLELRVPDQLTLDTDELVSLLDQGVGALRERGVDVLWPRSLGRDLSATATLDRASPAAPREEPLNEPLLGTEALFAFRWQVALHGDPLSDAEMDQLASSATPLMRLRGNWTVVDPSIVRKARKRLLRTVKPAEAVAAALTGIVQTGPEEGQQEQVVVGASLLKVREQLLSAATREPVEPPAALTATLRDYQRHGLTWLAELTSLGLGACLADDMGLGKTITLIALHLHRHEAGATGPTLVVCPASLLGNWEDEVRRFAPGTPVVRFHGSARELDGAADGFVLTTYGTMQRDAERLGAVPWDLVVADEAQHVKNPRTSTARALRTIPSAARVALTGTPVENNLTELWAILDWAIPGLLGSRNAFRKAWAAPIESGREPTKAAQFAELIGPFLLRRRKSDPGIAPELPAKTETDHRIGLTREQVVLYESFVRDIMERIERADEDTRRGLVLKLLTGLKQICNHPAQFLKQSAVRLAGRSQKIDLLDELLGTVLAEDGAALVFTQYVAMGRLLEAHLERAGVPHQFLHGGTPVREREAMVRRFQAGEAPVFLLSLKAGGTGLNLTRADHVLHVDRWWNPAVEEQATDRAYRIGQTRPVQVHRMITRGTIEERIAEMLGRKRALADAVLGRGEAALTELSNDELRDLVTLRPDARDS